MAIASKKGIENRIIEVFMKRLLYQPFYLLRYCKKVTFAFVALLRNRSHYQGVSFYPEEKRKTSVQVLLDQFLYILKYGEVDDRYFINGMDRKHFPAKDDILPHAVFKKVRDRLNRRPAIVEGYNYVMALKDKFYFNQFLTSIGFPTPTLRLLIDGNRMFVPGIRGWQPLAMILELTIDGCLKDLGGAFGKGVFSLKVENGRLYLDNQEIDLVSFQDYCGKGRLIVQDRVIQHPRMSVLNSSSVNTLRIVTVCQNKKMEVFGSFFRIGAVGSFTDNISRGGSLVEVDLKTGKLDKYGFITYPLTSSGKHETHPGTSIVYGGFEIPFCNEAVDISLQLHRFFYHIHSIGWDIAITETGPCIVEGNDSWGLPLQGLTRGFKTDFERMFNKL